MCFPSDWRPETSLAESEAAVLFATYQGGTRSPELFEGNTERARLSCG
jgi:hypothetical protein